jgi:hypothetical protein
MAHLRIGANATFHQTGRNPYCIWLSRPPERVLSEEHISLFFFLLKEKRNKKVQGAAKSSSAAGGPIASRPLPHSAWFTFC